MPFEDNNNLTLAKPDISALQDLHRKNLAFLKKAAPHIYEQYAQYRPTSLCLATNQEGAVNLVNIQHNNLPVYEGDPKDFCARQISAFLKKPKIASFRPKPTPVTNERHIHVPLFNQLLNNYEKYFDSCTFHCNGPIGTLIVSGCGLGYHIPLLAEKLDIHHLIIFEPIKDSFYASLSTIDWQAIISDFTSKGRSVKLLVGVEPKDSLATLQLHARSAGLHNIMYTFYFNHLKSQQSDEFLQLFNKEFHVSALGTGFFDDEQVGLAHTIANINRKVPLFKGSTFPNHSPPVFVIANGPSLDDHIDFITQHQNKAIVISCGTAISSLNKTGIKPDFHVEMERNINVREWITEGTTATYRQGITLLCLNTVSPDVMALFDDVCMAKKPNDIGETLLNECYEGDPAPELSLCNPTVANAGLSFSLAMGFREVYLFGVDLGLRKTGEHHSKLSIYSDLEEATQQKGHSDFEDTQYNYFIKGNFEDEVSTNFYFDSTRVNMEHLLRQYSRGGHKVRCFNPNNGAYIDGTIPVKQQDIHLGQNIAQKQELVKQLKSAFTNNRTQSVIEPQEFINNKLSNFFKLQKALELPKKVNRVDEIHSNLNRVYNLIAEQKQDPIVQHLLLGSLNEFFSVIFKATAYQKDKNRMIEAYRMGHNFYSQFIKGVFKTMKSTPLKMDDTYDNIGIKLSSGGKKNTLEVSSE